MRIVNGKSVLKAGLAVLGCASFMVFAVGCSTDAPVAPGTMSNSTENAFKAAAFADSIMRAAGPSGLAAGSDLDYLKDSEYYLCDAATKTKIDAAGGELKIQLDNDEIFFVVPAGALNTEVEIEIVGFKFRTPYGDVWIYGCGPDGLEFSVPMWVDHPIDKQDGEAAALIYIDEEHQNIQLELEQVAPAQDGKVLFNIHHFSKYAIS
jgi:hypothetical protein